MNDLMLHVESIVRPVRARQSWKLRARRELLSHLQSSYDEELSLSLDETAALDRAKSRLGDPVALTHQLQQSVPVLDRALLTELTLPRALKAWEVRDAQRLGLVPGLLSYAFALHFAAFFFPYAAGICVARMVDSAVYLRALFERPIYVFVFYLACNVLMVVGWMTSARFIADLAAPAAPANRRRVLRPARHALALLACYTAVTFACVTGVGRRPVTPDDLARTFGITAALLFILAVVARILAAHRRPYDEWLTLDVAR